MHCGRYNGAVRFRKNRGRPPCPSDALTTQLIRLEAGRKMLKKSHRRMGECTFFVWLELYWPRAQFNFKDLLLLARWFCVAVTATQGYGEETTINHGCEKTWKMEKN
jgi:hypothetical protein